MLRARLKCLKHITYALLTLVFTVCALEVGLRVHDSYTAQVAAKLADGDKLMTKCGRTHHRLKPLRRLIGRDPDTQAPVPLTTNSFGLRGREIEVPKPSGVYRVVCLGDESTLAPSVPEQETFCARLEASLQERTWLRVEVVNAGVPGYCPLLSYLQVKHLLSSLQPDLVLLNFDMSDVADDHRYRRHTLMSESVPLACPHPDLEPRPRHHMTKTLDHFLLPAWCRKQWDALISNSSRQEDYRDIDALQGRYAWLRDNPLDWTIYIQQALSPIELLSDTSERLYARFLVAAYPAPWQVSATASSRGAVRARVGVPDGAVYRSRAPFEILSRHLARLRIPSCDASVAFQRADSPDRLYFDHAPRFSSAGHALYADVLHRFVVQNVTGIWQLRPSAQPPMAAGEGSRETLR